MNSRTPVLHAPRSGASSGVTGGSSTPVSTFNPGHRSQSARVIRQPPHSAIVNNNNNKKPGTPHVSKTGGLAQRKQLNTAFYASPRKTSAPSKLINALGGSLDSLPSTVSVRRKVSTPAKALGSTISSASSQGSSISSSSSNKENKERKTSAPVTKTTAVIYSRPRKTSAATVVGVVEKKTSTTEQHNRKNSAPSIVSTAEQPRKNSTSSTISTSSSTASGQRMSKDHGGSGGSSPKGSPPPVPEESSTPEVQNNKPGKKASTSTSPDGAVSQLPTVKEEKKQKLSLTPDKSEKQEKKKMSNAKSTAAPAVPLPQASLSMPPDAGGTAPLPVEPPNPEKLKLEKLVSDLVKNAESKKQEIAALKMEIGRLKEAAKDRGHSSEEEFSTPNTSLLEHDLGNKVSDPGTVASLTEENCLLRSRLLQLGVALDSQPLSDQEKELLLAKVAHLTRQDASNAPSCGTGGGATAGSTDWDNKSSSSMSEVSVACLQDRIQQMEETHYCTNEELQATLQELEDLREQLQECQHEINQLTEEKQVILESLTQQTEKLTESRSQNDTLKQMLIQHSENSQDLSQCEKTQRLMELLKSAQEDRELLQIKQEELEQQLAATNQAQERFHHDSQLIRDRMKLLEAMVEAAQSEKKSAETQLAASQEQAKATEIENQRLTTALDSAKEKIVELEAAVVTGEKSELADVLERVRQEKDQLEKDNAALQQQLNASSCENQRIKEQLAQVQDDLMVARNNAKTQLDAADWKKSQLDAEHIQLQEEFEVMRNNLAELQMTSQRHLEDKRELKASLSEAQKKLAESFENIAEKERQFVEEKAHFIKQNEEWDQFQRDLLMTVRVANDFKTEAQHDLERLSQENQMLKDKQKHLMNEMEKFKLSTKVLSPSSSTNSVVNSVSSVPSAATDRRAIRSNSSPLSNGDTSSILSDKRLPRPLARGDSRVKSLIESIECATRQTRANSRSSSTSSLCSTSSETNIINNNNNNNNNKATTPTLKRADTESIIRSNSVTSPLKDFGNTLGSSVSPLRTLQRNSFTEGLTGPSYSKVPTSTNLSDTVKMSQLGDKSSKLTENGTKPISILSKLDTSMRRNSFGQDCFQVTPILEKKDPLASLAQGGGSKRNALLKWCQNKTIGYNNVDITNFSSSWNDGLALCAILDTYLPEKINFCNLSNENKRENFKVALAAAESVGVKNLLDINDMITFERPNWQTVYNYVTSVYCHFET